MRLKVFNGKAVVSANGSKHKVKKKWSLAWAEPDSEPTIEKFDRSQKDSLDKWQGERVAALEAAERATRGTGGSAMDKLKAHNRRKSQRSALAVQCAGRGGGSDCRTGSRAGR